MKKISPRDLGFYALIIVLLFAVFFALQNMDNRSAPTYSHVRQLFEQEQVESFTLRDNLLTMTLREPENGSYTLTYRLPSFQVF